MDATTGSRTADLAARRLAVARLRATTRRVAVLSLCLALLLELLLLFTALASSDFDGLAPFAVDAVQKVAWSFLLCASLATGLEIAAGNPLIVAFSGLVAAPIASLVARAALEGAHALVFAQPLPAGPAPLLVAAIRGLEYASLGVVVGWLARQRWRGARHHALAGFATGLVYGGILLFATALTPPDALALLRWGINELLFPIGCALILYAVGDAVPASGEMVSSKG